MSAQGGICLEGALSGLRLWFPLSVTPYETPILALRFQEGFRNSSLCALAQFALLNDFIALVTRTANSHVGAQACVCSSKVHAKKWQQS